MGFLLVFIGSGIGGMARHGVSLLALKCFGTSFPFGTLAINITGSFLGSVDKVDSQITR